MRLAYFPIFFLLFSVSSMAQKVQVLDETSREPIVGVTIFNTDKSKSAISSFDGFVSLSNFNDLEIITFQHLSHLSVSLTKKEILNMGAIVYLQINTSELEEVVLSVAKFAQSKKRLSQKVLSLSNKDMVFANPQTSADLLESSGQVFVQKSQLGGGSPIIRGFSTNRLLLSVDGVRMNTAIFRGGNLQNVISIDPFAIESSEIILGPGSVVYGSDAVGGVMNFYTLMPKFSFEKEPSLKGNVLSRFSTANEEKTGHIDLNYGLKNWAFLSSVSFSDFGDLRMGSHGPDDFLRPEFVARINGEDVVAKNSNPKKQRPTGYNQINTLQKIRFMPNESWDFNLALYFSTTSDFPRFDRLIRKKNGQFRDAEWFYGPQEWFSSNFQIQKKAENTFYDQFKASLSYQRFKESRNKRGFGKDILFETDEKVDAYTFSLDLTKKLKKHSLFYGLEYVYNKVNSVGKQTDINTLISQSSPSRYPDGSTWQSIAAYFSHQWNISPKLTLNSGLRYNHILIKASFDDKSFFDFPFENADIDTDAITGGLGLAWQANKTMNWKFNFSTAFRAPNIDDIGKIFDSEPGAVVVPNPNLDPEYAYSGELGLNLNFNNIVKIDLATYYTLLDNALVRRDFSLGDEDHIVFQGASSRIQAIQNASEARIHGFEAGLLINFSPEIQLSSQYNITGGHQKEEDGSKAPVRHVAPQFGNTHLTWKKNDWKFDAYAVYNGKFDFDDLAPSQQGNAHLFALDSNGNPFSPSWHTLNFRAQKQITEHWLVTTSLENITDQRYRTYSSGLAASGRNFILALKYLF